MKYLYTPFDIAVYFRTENLSITQEYNIINALWENKDLEIYSYYRSDKQGFKKKINHELFMMEGNLDDLDTLNLIFQEMGSKFSVGESDYEQGVIESYFKIIKLRLCYTPNTDFCKIKLRNLIGRFGYKRRTKALVEYMNRTIKALGLKAYLRGWETCDVGTVSLDDMIIFRKID
ncbi:hypothetical protein [Anaeromicropila herbilytica]|uniref:Uncharacterized protein n=1 Tax=Anaeromicropila herbilytica TaxID=2785025 RepID=A0A7R7EK06_9FIRM|nr:hypothetical protein [Anaeromicropila herbilytica]BCN30266.1 hypothetical protein bsdtb5_15610 [Anaeromicropila herbilytica]